MAELSKVSFKDSLTICVAEMLVRIQESTDRFKRLKDAFKDPMTEIYLFLFQAAPQIFSQLKLLLQRKEQLIGVMNQSLKQFL